MDTNYDKEVLLTPTENPEGMVERTVSEICSTIHIADEQYGNILLALTEAVDNAIVHGNKSDLHKKVHISCHYEPHDLIFSVSDEGQGFDFEHISDPTVLENPAEEGRGLFIMKHLADKVEFKNKGNTVLLSFHLN